MEQGGTGATGTTRTLSRGLAVLSAVLGAPQPPTLTELSLATDLAKPTVSRLLATLVDAGFAAQQPGSQTYLAGPSIARWLRTSPLEALLIERAGRLLEELRDLSGETAVLCVPAWPDRVCVLRAESTSPIRAHKAVGECAPLTRGCTGRAFLAFAAPADVDIALTARPLICTTPTSLVDATAFRERLQQERVWGYAISVEGTFPQMNGIASPITSSVSSMPIGVLNVSGPSNRWTEPAMTEFASVLMERTAALSACFVSEVRW